jgi:hypothetical protein
MELQDFITNTDNYLQELKKHNIYIHKKKDLALVKTHYNREYDYNTYPWMRFCRGAIIDLKTDKLLCIPPSKSSDIIDINNINKEGTYDMLVDGTMINMFYHDEKWDISSRSNIGCKNSWDGKLSFLDMFHEVSNDIQYNKDLKKNCCYSFVLQHSKNRIVSPLWENKIIFVQQYNLDTMERVDLDELYHIEKIPKLHYNDYNINLHYGIKGLTFYKDGVRYKWINPNYKYVTSLKMNHNDKFLNYSELRKKHLLKEYLVYFPEDSHQFTEYQRKYYLIKNHLYDCYVKHFIKKELELKDINYSLKPHLFKLHDFYKTTNQKINSNIVNDYVHELDGKQIMFICNYLF